MRVALINGSPKVRDSASGILLEDLKEYLGKKAETAELGFHTAALSAETMEELAATDALVIACPLYVDSIPGHLLSCLVQIEEARLQNPEISVYGIVNCGFYEGIQAEYALKILQNWSIKAGFCWGGGIGVGGGGGLAMMPKVESGHGPRVPIEKALAVLAGGILQKEARENQYVSVAFPRFLYRLAAQTGWRQMIKANGGKRKDLGKIPGEIE